VRVLRKLLLVTLPAIVIGVVLMAAGVEAWVRASWDVKKGVPGFFLSDPVRGQRLAANYTGWFAGVPVHINSLELRDPREYPLEKDSRTFRILVLGDSVTFGHGSVYEHTYPYLLEQRLKAWRPDVDWQVWNAAVPGYNTSQELAQLLEIGPRLKPDLVVVGFFENDLADNRPIRKAGEFARAATAAIAFARRHVYSLELYKKLYLQIAWRLRASAEYRRRIEHLSTEEALLERAGDATALAQQNLTRYDRLRDDEVRGVDCVYGMKPNPASVPALQRDPGFAAWVDAVRGFERLNRDGVYRIAFFLNDVPPTCPDGDVFYDGGSKAIDDLYLREMSQGAPAVSAYDEFLHMHPSQMPNAAGHSLGNSNVVKADVLFRFLRDCVLPSIPTPAAAS